MATKRTIIDDLSRTILDLREILDNLDESPVSEKSRSRCRWLADRSLAVVEKAKPFLQATNLNAAVIGQKGGKKTAALMTAKDPDYFKKLAAMRKTNAGGRPKKEQPAE